MKNLERYKDDLKKLIESGGTLLLAMRYEYEPDYEDLVREKMGDEEGSELLSKLPNFSEKYETWYSEAKTLIGQLLPDRLDDFAGHYEKPKARKDIDYESYRISDCLMSLVMTNRSGETIIGPDAAIPRFRQQLFIVKAVKDRFESSLFDIRQIAQADLFDSELEAAEALVKHGFFRAGGVLAGVVMERHLAEVCKNHKIIVRRKNPAIADFNEALKKENVINLTQWRFNQHLGDIRNLCTHNRKEEPSSDKVTELIHGVMKITKTLF